jgi:hypothetical protein
MPAQLRMGASHHERCEGNNGSPNEISVVLEEQSAGEVAACRTTSI